MVNKKESTEFRIVEAAKEVFILKGYDGARMQEIADAAIINKALLHYYFRSKDKLFERVFHEIFTTAFFSIAEVLEGADTLEDLISSFVSYYVSMLKKQPYLPNFILHELNRNPSMVVELIKSSGMNRSRLIQLFVRETERDDIRTFNPIHIIVNVLALSIFPFVASPIIKGFIFDGNEDDFDNFIDERTTHIISFINAAVFKNKIQNDE